jgi:hypothetical protein
VTAQLADDEVARWWWTDLEVADQEKTQPALSSFFLAAIIRTPQNYIAIRFHFPNPPYGSTTSLIRLPSATAHLRAEPCTHPSTRSPMTKDAGGEAAKKLSEY